MNVTLRSEDRRAVDLLLDRSPTAANGTGNGHSVYATADPSLAQRVAHAQQLLHLLDALPVEEPDNDLISRTMRAVDRSSRGHSPMRSELPQVITNQRPVA